MYCEIIPDSNREYRDMALSRNITLQSNDVLSENDITPYCDSCSESLIITNSSKSYHSCSYKNVWAEKLYARNSYWSYASLCKQCRYVTSVYGVIQLWRYFQNLRRCVIHHYARFDVRCRNLVAYDATYSIGHSVTINIKQKYCFEILF